MPKPNIKDMDLAAGFFSSSSEETSDKIVAPNIEVPKSPAKNPTTKPSQKKSTRTGKKKMGRPTVANKKKQYSLTMRPDLYELLMEKAKEKQTSFSQLITEAALDYLNRN